jgi:hypothetical protein
MLFVLPALLGAGCAAPPPEPPAPPPSFQPVAVTEPERLAIQARSRPAEGGRRLVEIFINGRRVAEGKLSAATPRGEFHGQYDGHDVLAECTLEAKVLCSVSIDGDPREGASTTDLRAVSNSSR